MATVIGELFTTAIMMSSPMIPGLPVTGMVLVNRLTAVFDFSNRFGSTTVPVGPVVVTELYPGPTARHSRILRATPSVLVLKSDGSVPTAI